MIVLDEHLKGYGLEDAIRQWYRGKVVTLTALRRLFAIAGFRTQADRVGKVVRVTARRVWWYGFGCTGTESLLLHGAD